MSKNCKIQWTMYSWNPVAGCEKISSGCANCYAIKDAIRMGNNPNPKVSDVYKGLAYRQDNGVLNWTGVVRCLPERLAMPYEWSEQGEVFVNSLSDLFHEDVPEEFIAQVFEVMRDCSWLSFQVLTKRAERMAEVTQRIRPSSNVWCGVSVENQAAAYRIELLKRVPARVRFLSVEPMIGPVVADIRDIQWVITGGESGPRARPFDPAWAMSVRDQCEKAGAQFFHKQNGGKNKKATGRLLEGQEYNEMPDGLLTPVPSTKERNKMKAKWLVPHRIELPTCETPTVVQKVA